MAKRIHRYNRAGGVFIASKNAAFKAISEIPLPEQLQELEVTRTSVAGANVSPH